MRNDDGTGMLSAKGVRHGFGGTAALAAAMLLLAACGKKEQPAPPPTPVTVMTVQAGDVPLVIELPARIQARRTSEVRARVDGIVQRRLYEEGTDVRPGTPLFQIDPAQNRAAYNNAVAQLRRAQAAATNAGQVANRYQPLVKEQAISKQEYDAAIATLRQSEADVASAQATVDRAKLDLDYTTVTAPIAGRAGRAQVTEGALVSASQATLMATIEQVNPIYVNFSQSSSDLLQIRQMIASGKVRGLDVGRIHVKLLLEDGTPYGPEGTIDFLDAAVDESTGTVSLRAEVANPEGLLLPGQFVRARLSGGVRTGGIMIPARAVQVSPSGATVMLVDATGKAEARPVKVGALQGGNWIIESGLKPGDKLIVEGLQKVRPGAPVQAAAPGQKPGAQKPATQPAQK
ncbi:efflux RND transporter periplasmic adaptor subunit [Sphingomonas crocodyli]|uniref:Efflux RND transporter periplasmic adaptor subunit n=1 Tax=Sphingomonas crocodyli TaxID=1979270 RepID=A0A437MAH0_9SPHN|nr:efflux RND transporter periplasmic adaptor subunit [Sphingomonas crocodyli]RVT94618.1 efflux RND transporter periplasmic adaptor subunit [Sphingomonas crocodyli]